MIFTMNSLLVFLPLLKYGSGVPIVSTKHGLIKGTELTTNIDTKYYAFWNIPYGKPPIGALKFQAPQPADPWTGIRDGTKEGNSCVYMNHYPYYPDPGPQDEDCLYLNVYTPNLKMSRSQKLPVMFWIYGGGFRAGSGIFKYYGPQNLIDENVVVVTFNYRLGPLGFLSTGDHVIPGNAGLKDQNLALGWVKENIEYFGGDPERITIFGESAGGMSVGMHLISEKSKDLFCGAICESGCTLSTTLNLDPRSFIYNYTNLINPAISEKNTSEEVRDFLLTVPVDKLMSYALQVDQHQFVPVLEEPSDSAFITNSKSPYSLIESGKANGQALLIGTTDEESLGFISEQELMPAAIDYNLRDECWLPSSITLKNSSDLISPKEFIEKIYFKDTEGIQDNLAGFLKYYSDNLFGRAAYKQAKLQSRYQTVYFYRFSFYGTVSKVKDYIVEGAGKVGHFSELPYLFNMTQYPLNTTADEHVRRKFAKLWANFATHLNPTPIQIPLLDSVMLNKCSPEHIYVLNIDTNMTVLTDPRERNMHSWSQYWKNFVQKPYIVY